MKKDKKEEVFPELEKQPNFEEAQIGVTENGSIDADNSQNEEPIFEVELFQKSFNSEAEIIAHYNEQCMMLAKTSHTQKKRTELKAKMAKAISKWRTENGLHDLKQQKASKCAKC